jgi:hypothetical protein
MLQFKLLEKVLLEDRKGVWGITKNGLREIL